VGKQERIGMSQERERRAWIRESAAKNIRDNVMTARYYLIAVEKCKTNILNNLPENLSTVFRMSLDIDPVT